jgi:hypothetical protein
MEGFDFDRLTNLNRAAVHDLATCRFVDERVAVLIAGPCGTGNEPSGPGARPRWTGCAMAPIVSNWMVKATAA